MTNFQFRCLEQFAFQFFFQIATCFWFGVFHVIFMLMEWDSGWWWWIFLRIVQFFLVQFTLCAFEVGILHHLPLIMSIARERNSVWNWLNIRIGCNFVGLSYFRTSQVNRTGSDNPTFRLFLFAKLNIRFLNSTWSECSWMDFVRWRFRFNYAHVLPSRIFCRSIDWTDIID